MKGTEKQVAWAMDIENHAIETLTKNIDRMGDEPLFTANVQASKLMLAIVHKVFTMQDDASKIIERRYMFEAKALFQNCDQWANQIRSGKTTISELAAKNGIKDFKE